MLRVRGTKKDLIQDSSSEEFCLIVPGVIARCDGSVVQNMLQKWFEEANPQFRNQKQENQDSEFRNQKRILKILKKGEKLTLSPSGTLAAITGSLGRILLLDTQALVGVRLWKGYRDASCFIHGDVEQLHVQKVARCCNPPVGLVLAMSSAFGNRMLKPFVVAEPEIQEQKIEKKPVPLSHENLQEKTSEAFGRVLMLDLVIRNEDKLPYHELRWRGNSANLLLAEKMIYANTNTLEAALRFLLARA
ncbi:hypothetical protein KIW84_020410 [Lathyrus oleraceus]|uniref:Uncharacterized protein n=1 Tax=Pisum sativum TaxID=3888 RepID=A0A9D4Y5M1_PEA|nr:hypothetical protein KIW84_020409 [Pisum sativum]KAI5433110.1 hypothetical protein KIW84_020410 [Pisum sativum]